MPLQHSLRLKSDPTPKDICKAFAELAMEAGFVHGQGGPPKRGPQRLGELNRKALAEHLGQNRQTISVWTNDIPPNVIDLPWIERKLNLRRGAILERAGYVERKDLISVIESDERITPVLRESLVAYTQTALELSSNSDDEALRKTSLAS